MGDQARRAFDHVGKPQQVTIGLILQLRPVTGDDEIRQLPHLLRLFAVIKVFEMTEAHMAFRHPQQHRAAFRLLAVYRLLTGDNS
ncbi:Uncharacterised protein [Acinetobacter baumannii]|nr:Uncharacterised protein [Acinetobacter baumannii]